MVILFVICLIPFREKSVICPIVESGPKIDGSLVDSVWQMAISFDDFIEVFPDENQMPQNKTVCYILRDKDNLYFGFICYNSDKIVANNLVRDKFSNDEKINILLCPNNDQNTGYALFVSPLNTQIDIRLVNNGEKMLDWDGIWYSATKRTSNGWNCEIKIPFTTFKEGAGKIYWGMEICRETYIKDQQILINWANPNYELLRPSDFGRLCFTEETPFLSEAAFMPHFVLQTKFLPDSSAILEPRIGIETIFSPFIFSDFNLVFNPDFSQIEADPEEIDLSKTIRKLPEKRNFFLSGSENFKTPIQIMYTRRIEKINYGVKARFQPQKVAIVGWHVDVDSTATDPHAKISSVAFNLNFLQSANLNLLFINRYTPSFYNNDFSVALYQPLPKDFSLSSQIAFDWTEHRYAKAYYLSIERQVYSGVRMSVYHKMVDSAFVAPLGYIPFRNIRETCGNLSWFNLINHKLIQSFEVGFSCLHRISLLGNLLCQNFSPFANITFVKPVSIYYSYTVEKRRFGIDMYDNFTNYVSLKINPVKLFSLTIGYLRGSYFGQHIDYLSLSSGNLNFANRIFLELNTESQHLQSDEETTLENIVNFKINCYIFKNIYLRQFFKYSDLSNTWNLNFVVDYNVTSGSHLYFILNEEREKAESLFITDLRERILSFKIAYRLSF